MQFVSCMSTYVSSHAEPQLEALPYVWNTEWACARQRSSECERHMALACHVPLATSALQGQS